MDVATASVSGWKLRGNTVIRGCHWLLLGFSTWNMEYIGSPYSQHNQSVSRIQRFICQVWSQLSRFYSSDLWSRELVSINGFISKQKEFKSASSAVWLQSWELLRHTNPTSGWLTHSIELDTYRPSAAWISQDHPGKICGESEVYFLCPDSCGAVLGNPWHAWSMWRGQGRCEPSLHSAHFEERKPLWSKVKIGNAREFRDFMEYRQNMFFFSLPGLDWHRVDLDSAC